MTISAATGSAASPGLSSFACDTTAAGRRALASAVFFLVALVLVFGMSTHKDLDVDESPFIASGVLLNRGVLPYRDYQYNHMPTEVMVYALIFRGTSHLLLAARTFQSVCGAAEAAALFFVAYGAFAHLGRRRRLVLAWAAGLAMLANPLFTRTAGICWNHDFPLLAALLAFLCLCRGLRGERPGAWTAGAGFLLAVAFTTRLTFAPIGAGFVLLLLLRPGLSVRRRIGLLALFGAGMLVACLPSIWVWAQAPRNAFFGNFLYPRLNTKIHALQPDEKGRPFTLLPILGFYVKMWFTLPGNGVLTVAFVALSAAALKLKNVCRVPLDAELAAVAAIVVLLVASGVMPAPSYPQYFYAPTPFMILGVILSLSRLSRGAMSPRVWQALGAGLAITLVMAVPAYRGVAFLLRPKKWVPMIVHAGGVEVARLAGSGTILTFEPVYPCEGGLDTVAELATGRFEFRVADLLPPADRVRYKMPGPESVGPWFDRNPPRGVLVVKGTAGKYDHLLVDAARAHGYRQYLLATPGSHTHRRAELWLRPDRSSN